MAELPHLGQHCGADFCNLLDFLPIRCDACSGTFCNAHYTYDAHKCNNVYEKNVQVPVCPMCDQPVPTPKGVSSDFQVNEHIMNNCTIAKKKIFSNRCSQKGCKKKELIPVICTSCNLNYCIGHRHEKDHDCAGNQQGFRLSNTATAAVVRNQGRQNCASQVRSTVLKDEAMARALAASLNNAHINPEEIDRRLAEQLQQEEYQNHRGSRGQLQVTQIGNSGNSCSIS